MHCNINGKTLGHRMSNDQWLLLYVYRLWMQAAAGGFDVFGEVISVFTVDN